MFIKEFLAVAFSFLLVHNGHFAWIIETFSLPYPQILTRFVKYSSDCINVPLVVTTCRVAFLKKL